MIRAYTAAQVRAAEQPLLAAGVPLMAHAAWALAAAVRAEIAVARVRPASARVLVLVGGGDNGGDGLFAAAQLARAGTRVDAALLGETAHPGGVDAAVKAGVVVHRLRARAEGATGADGLADRVLALATHADAWVDALTGIGARAGLREPLASVVAALEGHRRASAVPPLVIAADLPSGIGPDDGAIAGPVLCADRTVTFGAVKSGLLLPPAAAWAGRVQWVDLRLPLALEPVDVARLTPSDIGDLWPSPQDGDHKYTRGVLGIVAGSHTYPGAGVLAASAAVRAGAGMVRYVGPVSVTALVHSRHPEVVAGAGQVQAWVAGSGVSPQDDGRADDVVRALADATDSGLPIVLDAGALPLLPEELPANAVLTPHAGELAALLRARGEVVTRADVEAHGPAAVRRAVELTGATVLLKGSTTLVAGPGTPLYSQADGTGWLATAGTGDVLAGLLGVLLASRSADVLADPALAARLAAAVALVHGLAGRSASRGGPIAALDVADAIPAVLRELLTL